MKELPSHPSDGGPPPGRSTLAGRCEVKLNCCCPYLFHEKVGDFSLSAF